MARPGRTINTSGTPAGPSARSRSGRWGIVDFTEKGPTGPHVINSLAQFRALYGGRVGWSFAYDVAETYFAIDGESLIVSRELGPEPVASSRLLAGASGNTLKVAAKSPGAWGDDIDVEIVVSGSTRTLNVYLGSATVPVESSLPQTSEDGLIDWSASAKYVTVTNESGTGLPVALSRSALSGGTDDHDSATDDDSQAALDLINADLGPMQISMPGRTTSTAHAQLRAHAKAFNRRAILDLVDTSAKATLKSATADQRTAGDSAYAAAYTPWLQIAGTAPGTTRTVPPCAFIAALAARNDAVQSANWPLAGDNGIDRGFIRGLTVTWSEADTTELSCPELSFEAHGSINVIRTIDGVIQAYGNRTLTDPITNRLYLQLSNVRFDMAVQDELYRASRPYVFRPIDGRGHTASALNTALVGVLKPYWTADTPSLFGEDEDDAYSVLTGSQVNTPETAAEGRLLAQVKYKRSPGAEEVVLNIFQVDVAQPLAA